MMINQLTSQYQFSKELKIKRSKFFLINLKKIAALDAKNGYYNLIKLSKGKIIFC